MSEAHGGLFLIHKGVNECYRNRQLTEGAASSKSEEGATQSINIIAILLSPLIAVLVSMWIQNRRERRQQQFWILSTLMASRSDPLTPDNIKALNLIDLTFRDKPEVRKLWHEYFDMLSNKGLDNPVGWTQRANKNIELITAMAKGLGYGKTISHLDVGRTYAPVGPWEQFMRGRELQEEFLRVLKATAKFDVEPKAATLPEVRKEG